MCPILDVIAPRPPRSTSTLARVPSTIPVMMHFSKLSSSFLMMFPKYLSFLVITELHNFLQPTSFKMSISSPGCPWYSHNSSVADCLKRPQRLDGIGRAGFRGARGLRALGLPPTGGLPPNPSISLFFDWPTRRRCFDSYFHNMSSASGGFFRDHLALQQLMPTFQMMPG